jgi:sigma-B regulation protein RsbU (phosphoserine phosphatase)
MNGSSDSERVSTVIFNYAARIAHCSDLNDLLSLNADMARDLVAADRCSIWLVNASTGELETKVAHGTGQIHVPLGSGLVGSSVATGEPVLVNDTSLDRRFLNRIDQSSGYVTHSVLVVPLRASDGRIIGAFQALNKAGGFSDADVSLLGLAGAYSAAAIEAQRLRAEAESARLMLRDLEIARDVQAALLPQTLPKSQRLDCAAFFRPARLIGGDYYDFIDTPERGLAFTLGDVSGKGVPAAVLMASIQASLRISLQSNTRSLSSVIELLNDSVYESSNAGRYSTAFCGILDPACESLTYVNAAQCPPLLYHPMRSESKVELLSVGGTPIGLLPGQSYEEGKIRLSSGDILLCFSDGISEAVNEKGEFWMESEIEKLLQSSDGWTASQLTEALASRVDEFAGAAEQADDMTIVALRVL